MAKFVFKLQSLLNVKNQMEENLKNELGKAIQKLEYEKSILKRLEEEKEENIGHIYNKSNAGISVGELREYNAYIGYLGEKILLQKENINYAQDCVDKYREELIKIVREREMLEKLKEKKYKDYLNEQLQEEQRLNDEIVSFKYNTKDK